MFPVIGACRVVYRFVPSAQLRLILTGGTSVLTYAALVLTPEASAALPVVSAALP